jgi:ADP-ribosylglycohydrolase
MNPDERFRGCLLGLAVGDAVGTTLEFRLQGTFQPLTDMVGAIGASLFHPKFAFRANLGRSKVRPSESE